MLQLYTSHSLIKPFLKWAGGKAQLLKEIKKYYPFNDNITKYAEPFVGGGAVLFDILNNFNLKKIYISDINNELINAYRVIQIQHNELIELLNKYQKEYWPLSVAERNNYFLKKRELFNRLKLSQQENDLTKAALLIFLNKTCFNGLYRVNKKGLFNVPIGRYNQPLICDADNLFNVHKKLRNVTIICCDYRNSADFIDEHTFVYFDPPYRALSATANFTSYTQNCFDDQEQINLAKFFEAMDRRGAKLLLSNSDPKNMDEKDNFFDKLYSPYNIRRLAATRIINCKGSARGKINELLVSNIIRPKEIPTSR